MQVKWKNRFQNNKGKKCKVTVDGTDYLIPRRKSFQLDKQYYSHKFKHAAYGYEIAICIQTGLIVWYIGPFRAGKWPHIKIFRFRLKGMLRDGEMVEPDLGYRGDPKVRDDNVFFSKNDQRAKRNASGYNETVNGDLKTFQCLNVMFRHDLQNHLAVFEACVFLTQLGYLIHGVRFKVKY